MELKKQQNQETWFHKLSSTSWEKDSLVKLQGAGVRRIRAIAQCLQTLPWQLDQPEQEDKLPEAAARDVISTDTE